MGKANIRLDDTDRQLISLLKEKLLTEKPNLSPNDKLDLVAQLILQIPHCTEVIIEYIEILKQYGNKPGKLRLINGEGQIKQGGTPHEN